MARGTVVVVGAGYVGLPLAYALAGAGLRTHALDIVPERVMAINEGRSPILGDEPGLQDLLARTVAEGTLTASADPSVISQGDFVLVCWSTNLMKDHMGRVDGPVHKVTFPRVSQLGPSANN